MIGKILNITPITGRQATKREVLKRISSVSLVHFAAHGCMETGEIALTPDPKRKSTVPREEDYILTIGDVLNVQLRAKLVVLSCCHSCRGEVWLALRALLWVLVLGLLWCPCGRLKTRLLLSS